MTWTRSAAQTTTNGRLCGQLRFGASTSASTGSGASSSPSLASKVTSTTTTTDRWHSSVRSHRRWPVERDPSVPLTPRARSRRPSPVASRIGQAGRLAMLLRILGSAWWSQPNRCRSTSSAPSAPSSRRAGQGLASPVALRSRKAKPTRMAPATHPPRLNWSGPHSANVTPPIVSSPARTAK